MGLNPVYSLVPFTPIDKSEFIKNLFYTFEKTSVLKQQKTALVCPLNWGLGHASRVIPIIRLLIKYNIKVIVATDGNALGLLKKEFPGLSFIKLAGYEVKLSPDQSHYFRLALLSFKILFYTIKEHYDLKKIIHKHDIQIVISDNRFGLWNKNIYSVCITHQLQIDVPKILSPVNSVYKRLLHFILRHYNECWVPDLEGEINLAGKLSHPGKIPSNLKYIGLLSRFYPPQKHTGNLTTDVLFILSGPEPQRSVFENRILKQAKGRKERIVLVRGTNARSTFNYPFPVYDLITSHELLILINQSKMIVCRSGHSSVMDLVALGKQAFLVPTPGQTEQEYLALHLKQNKFFNWASQDKFKYEMIFEEANDNNTESLRHSFVEREISRLSEIE